MVRRGLALRFGAIRHGDITHETLQSQAAALGAQSAIQRVLRRRTIRNAWGAWRDKTVGAKINISTVGRTADERLTRGPKDWSSPFFFLSWMKTLILCTVNPSIFASDRASLQCAARRAVAELPSLRQRDSGWQLVHLFRFGHVQLLAEYGEGIVTEETVVMAE